MPRKIATEGEVSHGQVHGIDLGDKKIALFRVGDEVLATADVCPHANCLLSEYGSVIDDMIECSCHGSGYDIRTGENIQPPWADRLTTYEVIIDGEDILIDD